MSEQKPYAIIELAGSQHLVHEGDFLEVNSLEAAADSTLTVEDVLLFADGKNQKIGTPKVKGAQVELKVLSQYKGPKLRVATYTAKSRNRRVMGHRQALTKLQVVRISA